MSLDLEEKVESNPDRVLFFIQENPGCHLRQIKRELKISIGTVQYHLDRLEKIGKINSSRNGLYKYYFPVGIFDQDQKHLLQILRQETAREILMFIIEQKNPIQTDIVNRIGISPAAVNWHMRRLMDLNIINEIKGSKHKRYELRSDPKYVMALLRRYYPNMWEKWSMRFMELFLSVSNRDEK